ncbi:hypothetical protein Tco_1307535, partial [Tanacetum coccineum]
WHWFKEEGTVGTMVPRTTTFLGSLPSNARGFFDIVPWLRGPHGVLIKKGTTASFKGL